VIFDENLPRRFVEHFSERLGKIAYAGEGSLKGVTNGILWSYALHERALLITQDKGFRRRYSYHGETEVGILLLATHNQTAPNLIVVFEKFLNLQNWQMDDFVGKLVVIDEKGVLLRSVSQEKFIGWKKVSDN